MDLKRRKINKRNTNIVKLLNSPAPRKDELKMMTMGVNWWMRSLTSHWMSLVKITGHNEKSNKFTKITDTVKFEFKITVVDKRFTKSNSRGLDKRSSSEKWRWSKTKLINSKTTLRM